MFRVCPLLSWAVTPVPPLASGLGLALGPTLQPPTQLQAPNGVCGQSPGRQVSRASGSDYLAPLPASSSSTLRWFRSFPGGPPGASLHTPRTGWEWGSGGVGLEAQSIRSPGASRDLPGPAPRCPVPGAGAAQVSAGPALPTPEATSSGRTGRGGKGWPGGRGSQLSPGSPLVAPPSSSLPRRARRRRG